jgi:hypothetical protein
VPVLKRLARALRRAGDGAARVIAVVLRSLALLAFVGCASLNGLSAPQEAQLADFEGCADKVHVGYRAMRLRVITVMLQQRLDLAETVTGLEAVDEIRSGRDVRTLSSADVDFINRNEFLRFPIGEAMGRTWFAGLRRCLEDRHGYKIRRIEFP